MSEHQNDPTPSAQQPPYGPPPTTGQPYGQYEPQQFAQPAQYPTQQYGPYGQPNPYGQPAYGQYGQVAIPAKPAQVVVPGVLGFIFGAFGVLFGLGAIIGGAALGGLVSGFNEGNGAAGAVTGFFVVLGLVILAWTVVMIWGSVWALRGRSRVMLLVAGSIALAFSMIGFFGSVGDSNSTGGGIVFSLLLLLGAVAIVVLLCLRPSAQFFAAHRARRGA